jgi:hypothetical protein
VTIFLTLLARCAEDEDEGANAAVPVGADPDGDLMLEARLRDCTDPDGDIGWRQHPDPRRPRMACAPLSPPPSRVKACLKGRLNLRPQIATSAASTQ